MKITLSPSLKDYLVSEFRTAAELLAIDGDRTNNAYDLSALFGATSRVLNIDYSDNLVLLHMLLQTAHAAINTRIMAIDQGTDPAVRLASDFFEIVSQVVSDLADKIDMGRNCDEQLGRLAALAYTTTGNGYYLYKTGRIKLSSSPG